MSHSKRFISFLIMVLSVSCCKAQDSSKYVYQDSTVKQTEAAPVADSAAASTTPVVPDTILHLNSLTLSRDSITALKNSKPFAYAKNLDSLLKALKDKNKETSQRTIKDDRPDWLEKLLASSFISSLLWILAGLFIAFILYRLFFIEGSFFKSRVRLKSNVNELGEETKDSYQDNYDQRITQAINNKDYRLAVRYLYLKSLQCLAENGCVQLVAEKTNYQYLNELSNTAYKNDFSLLTRNYEYVWYGEFSLDETVFNGLKNSFEQFNNRLQKN